MADVLAGRCGWAAEAGDCLPWLRGLPTGAASMTLFSPPYQGARSYGVGFRLKGVAWVEWLAERVVEMARVTDGLVLCNAAGQVKQHSYNPVVEWLVNDLTRVHGLVCGPSPYCYHRPGIPGKTAYHRRDWEPVYAFCRKEVLPLAWTDPLATGHPPRWAPGGAMAHRLSPGQRVNQWGPVGASNGTNRKRNGTRDTGRRPSHQITTAGASRPSAVTANSGNVVRCHTGGRGGLASQNEAPMPEALAEFFVRSYAPPGSVVLDPMCGSGTTLAVSVAIGRRAIGCDLRPEQVELARRRVRVSLGDSG